MVLAEMKLIAEEYVGHTVTKAVVTVPAYFNDNQRQATKDAGAIAGLDVIRIINEPTAAALAYGFGKKIDKLVAVYDLGGGTFDISILEIGSAGVFNGRVIDWLVEGFRAEHGVDLRKDRMALQRLKDAAEKGKIELSSVKEAQINLPFISTPPGGGAALHLQHVLTRQKLEELTADLADRTLKTCEQVLAEAKVKPSDLKEIILVGGMTRMPRIVEGVRSYFKREPCKGVHPEEVVALGACIQAHALVADEGEVLLLDVTPQSLGVAIAGGYARRLIPKNTTVPTSVTEVFNTSKDQQTTVKIMVLQGEADLAHQNELLGEFILTGLREAPRGEVEIDVTFDINAEGILSVSARDKETGQRQSITVTASGGLTDEELRKIMEEQRDYLLEARMTEELKLKRTELEGSIREIAELLPRVRQITVGSNFGAEVISRAERTLSQGRRALDQNTLREIVECQDQTSRTLNLFRGVIQKMGG